MFYEYLELECIALITKISCLLVYYDFQLIPLIQTRFENCKQLFTFHDPHDMLGIFISLFNIEQGLIEDIQELYEPYVQEPEKHQHSVWALV